jgi:hypothetical protein
MTRANYLHSVALSEEEERELTDLQVKVDVGIKEIFIKGMEFYKAKEEDTK